MHRPHLKVENRVKHLRLSSDFQTYAMTHTCPHSPIGSKHTAHTHTKINELKLKIIRIYFAECNQWKHYQLTATNLSIWQHRLLVFNLRGWGNTWQTTWQWTTCQPCPTLDIQMDSAKPAGVWLWGTSWPWHMRLLTWTFDERWVRYSRTVPVLFPCVCLHGILMTAKLQIPLKGFENTFRWFPTGVFTMSYKERIQCRLTVLY